MAKKSVRFNLNPLLSGPSLEARTKAGSPYRELGIEDIDVDPDQPRKEFKNEELTELSASIKEHGVLCPILVRVTAGGSYRLIAGERRLRAAKLAGLTTIPVVLDVAEGEQGVLAKQLVENLQRSALTPLERALAFGRLRDHEKLSVRDLAAKLGVSKSLAQRTLDILNLPDDLKAALRDGKPESKVLLLAEVTDKEKRRVLLAKLDDLSREELEAQIRPGQVSHRGTEKKGDGKKRAPLSPADKRIIAEIQEKLSVRVDIVRSPRKKESGHVTLQFYSRDDLEEIYRRLTQ